MQELRSEDGGRALRLEEFASAPEPSRADKFRRNSNQHLVDHVLKSYKKSNTLELTHLNIAGERIFIRERKLSRVLCVKMVELNEEERLTVELEFVQSLANPSYLAYLTQNGHLKNKKFLAYLEYLQYWHLPEYVSKIQYHNCLFFLQRLLDDKFRAELEKPDFISFVHKQQYYSWENNR